ncbi:MAG: S8 family serine peptidase [Candidatus Krumholzibacteriia bacterium]
MPRIVNLIACLSILSLAWIAAASAPGPHPSPAVRVGPGQDLATDDPHASDHLMVRLTRNAYERSQLTSLVDRGEAVAGSATGLPSLDAVSREIGVTRIAKALGPGADPALAARLGVDRVFRFDVPVGTDIAALAARLTADPDVETAAPDRYAHLDVMPNDPTYPAHWGHDNTAQLPGYDWGGSWDHTLPGTVGTPGFDADADLAWDAPSGFGSPLVTIAIIDTGVDPAHMDLNQVAGWDFGDNDNDPADDSAVAGHGTCCAGIAAAIPQNGYAAAGVAGGCRVMPLKVADSAGGLLLSNAAAAILHAANNGVDILSMSFSTAGVMSDPAMDPAIWYAAAVGLVMVAATGNDNTPVIDYPANHLDVIAVGAASPCGERKRSSSDPTECDPGVVPDPNGYTCDGERWWGSNYGAPAPDAPDAVDVLAPTILPTTDVTGAAGYRPGDVEPFFNGTSCAAPYAAGVCALILSANPALTRLEVRDVLVRSCTDVVSVESPLPGWDRHAGYGLVNAAQAVLAAVTPVAAFSAAPTGGCRPLMVSFTDLSSGPAIGWLWDFGDGGVDFVPNPLHLYQQAGTFTVSLTVTGPGGSDTLTLPGLITVDPSAVPDFNATVTSGFAPLVTTFVDASTGSPTDWDWNFGDGEPNENTQSPTHTYEVPGLFTVTLAVGNACGGDVLTRLDYIAACDSLHADFDVSATTGDDTLTVAFTDRSQGGPRVSWAWDFGDGGTSDHPDPVHFYAAPGSYTVTLIVGTPCEADTVTVADAVIVTSATGIGAPPAVFALAHNRPNPFNPSTAIAFSLQTAGQARLEVFDAAGRRVDVLVDGPTAAGVHEVVWRPTQQPSGVYFARLSSGGRTAIQRMSLVR